MNWLLWLGIVLGYLAICFLAWSMLAVSARADEHAEVLYERRLRRVLDTATITDDRKAELIREALERFGRG